MTIKAKAAELSEFINGLPDFIVVTEIDGNYQHLGAIIADAVLQANRNYETQVRHRIKRIREKFPDANTLSGVKKAISENTTSHFLDWKDLDRTKRFEEIVVFFSTEDIETENDLKEWLMDEENVIKLKKIKGIGPKTIDYFKILTGIQTCAIDRRLLDFLKQAGIEVSSYNEAKEIINSAADIMNIERAYFDHSIWKYMEKNKPKNCSKKEKKDEKKLISY